MVDRMLSYEEIYGPAGERSPAGDASVDMRVSSEQEVPRPDLDLAGFLDMEEPEFDWLIPGLLERGERLILTGPEGGGKSTLLRQMAVQMASGVHPFTNAPTDPLSVFLLDLENSRAHVRRALRPLALAADAPSSLRVRVKPDGIDLLSIDGELWLERRIQANRPDVVILGPLYRLADGDPTEERTAKAVTRVLDRLRTAYGFAVILEAHTPHGSNGGHRPTRPYGASLWLRWPEYGLHLATNGIVTHWRGPRDERDWPPALKRGGDWPWTVETDGRQVTFARMCDVVRDAGQMLSTREIAVAVGCGATTVRRAIDANKRTWDALREELEK